MSKHNRVVPYLTVKDADRAIKFYEEAFDAEELFRLKADDDKRIMHAELEINDGIIMLSDEFPQSASSGVAAPTTLSSNSVTIHLDFKKPKHVDQTIEQALRAGASSIMAPQDMFWGARYGRVRDPFGHIWAFNAPLKKKDRPREDDKS